MKRGEGERKKHRTKNIERLKKKMLHGEKTRERKRKEEETEQRIK